MAHKNNHDVKVGVIGLLIGVILGSTLALSSSEGTSEGFILRRDNGRENATTVQQLLDIRSWARRQ